jgi:hypothetical protein
MQPVYDMKAAGLKLLSVVLGVAILVEGVILVGLLVAGVPAPIAVLFLIGLLPCALIWLLLPRRFEIWRDRLVIVFPVLVRWNLHFDTIESVEAAKWWHPYAFMGVRVASSPGKSVDIMRREPNLLRRPNIVISPDDRDRFIARFNEAIERHRRS